MKPGSPTTARSDDDLLDIAIATAAMPLIALGTPRAAAIREVLETIAAVPAVRAELEAARASGTPSLTIEQLQVEFQLSDGRQIRRYIYDIWGRDEGQKLWLSALDAEQSGQPSITPSQAERIRSHRKSLFLQRAKSRQEIRPEKSETMCSGAAAVCGAQPQDEHRNGRHGDGLSIGRDHRTDP